MTRTKLPFQKDWELGIVHEIYDNVPHEKANSYPGKSRDPELTELTAMMQLQIDNDHSFDAFFPAESSASSLQDVTKLEFTQIRWTDDRLQRMSNLPDRLPALVELVLDGKR